MKTVLTITASFLALTAPAFAQQNTELNATCNDGSHYQGVTRENACHDHGGVQKWIESTTIAGPNEATVVGTSGKNSLPPAAPTYKEPGPSKNTGPNNAPESR